MTMPPRRVLILNFIADSDEVRADLVDALCDYGPRSSNKDLPFYTWLSLLDDGNRGFDLGLKIVSRVSNPTPKRNKTLHPQTQYELPSWWDGDALVRRRSNGEIAQSLLSADQTFFAVFHVVDGSLAGAARWIEKARVHRGVRLLVLFGVIPTNGERVVSLQEAQDFAHALGAIYCEAVAGDMASIRTAVEAVALAALSTRAAPAFVYRKLQGKKQMVRFKPVAFLSKVKFPQKGFSDGDDVPFGRSHMIGGKTPAVMVKHGRGRPPKLRVMDTPVVNNTTTESTTVTTEGLPAGLLQIRSPVPTAIQGLETALTNEKVHHGYFTSTSDNKAKAKGWANAALNVNAAHDINLSKTQVANKHERMMRKWRRNGLNSSKTVQTGNNPPDPAKVMSDEEMILMSQYFPQAQGADLGQAKTAGKVIIKHKWVLLESFSNSNEDDGRRKRKKYDQGNRDAALASAISAGMIAMADSFKTLSSNSGDDLLKSMLKEQTEAFKETMKGMKDLIAFMSEREQKRDGKE
ncbi:hypothetical protein DFJ73DRAFT_759749 [Zopfochytrium polystomum]|nr:hypothetical protein DFJ73DRAFT_759749 [Zopfochytrium polystomum]